MQFLLMCCFDERRWNELPQARRDEIMQAYAAWIDDATSAGKYVGGGKLVDTQSAACVTSRNGTATITDGPFAETKEQLGGYHIVDCSDRDEALALAARIPTLPAGGKIEVRPLHHLIPGLQPWVATQGWRGKVGRGHGSCNGGKLERSRNRIVKHAG